MFKNSIKRRITALIIAVICVLPMILTGCKKAEEAIKTKPDHVYKSEFITLPQEIASFDRFFVSNDKLYFTSYVNSEKGSKSVFYSMDQDGTNLKELISFDNTNSYLTAITMLPDGSMWVVSCTSGTRSTDGGPAVDAAVDDTAEAAVDTVVDAAADTVVDATVDADKIIGGEPTDTTQIYNMTKYAADGTEQKNVVLNDVFADIENFYIYSLSCDSKGNLYTMMDNTVYILDSDGKLKNKATFENGYINNIIIDASDNVFALCGDNNTGKMNVKTIDPETGKFGEDISFGTASNYSYGMVTGGKGSAYDFYYNNSIALCGLKTATGESTELCNWINSDVNSNQIGNITVINDDKIICTMYDELDGKQKLLILTRVPEEQVVEKYVITLAASYVDYNIRTSIIAFNRTSEEYRIAVKDYSVYNTMDDYTQAVTMLNNDIIAGNIPDIIQLNSDMPIDSYISKGLFADLNEYIANDPEIKRTDYLENIFDAFSVNGKMYELIPSFSVQTVAGKTSVVGSGSGWTMDEFNAMLEKYPDATAFFDVTQSSMLQNICTITSGQFIDKNTGICSFDSDGFIKILKFAKTLSDKSVYDNGSKPYYDQKSMEQTGTEYRDNKFLLQVQYLDSFRTYWQLLKGTFGEDINLIGFPTDNRNGSAITPTFELAMSAKTSMSEGAWQFLRYFLTDEYQDKMVYNFPVKLSRLDSMATESMKPYSWTDPATGVVTEYPTTWYIGNESIEIGEITQQYVDVVKNYLHTLTQVVRYDTNMMNIINEETAAFFAGSKTAEETAKIIQNRVSIYVSENR